MVVQADRVRWRPFIYLLRVTQMNFPKTMKAAILVEQKRPLTVDQVSLPQKLDVGQVLVKIHFSGICGSQLGEIDGAKGEDKYLPHLLGHEGSGTVVATGLGVRYVKPDDKVVLHWRKGLGIEAAPPVYEWKEKRLNAGWITTFSEYAVVSENRLTRIPGDSDLEVAALFGCAVTTGFGVIENDAKARIGESVVVYGAGGIGLNIVQAAALTNAYPIIAVDIHDNRLSLAAAMGATHMINSSNGDAPRKIEEIVGRAGVDVFIDNTGQPAIIEMGYSITKPQGRVVLVGVPKAGANISIFSLPMHFGKVITGSHGGGSLPEKDIPRYFGLYRAGKLKLREILTERFELSDINTAIERMRNGKLAGRCLLSIGQR